MIPVKVERVGTTAIRVEYRGEPAREISAATLRAACPCAVCREKRGDGASHAAPLTAGVSTTNSGAGKSKRLMVIEHTAEESMRIEQLWAVGNYALGVRWGDGHDDGIFTWQYLRELR